MPNGDYNAGHVVAYIIGLVYMLAFVYYIYRKYLNILFEDLLGILEVKYIFIIIRKTMMIIFTNQ